MDAVFEFNVIKIYLYFENKKNIKKNYQKKEKGNNKGIRTVFVGVMI